MRAQFPEVIKPTRNWGGALARWACLPKSCPPDGEAGRPREAGREGEEEKEDSEQGAGRSLDLPCL